MSNKKVTQIRNKSAPQAEEIRAKNIIVSKISILTEWSNKGLPSKKDTNGDCIRDKDGEEVIDYYPTSIQQFLKWNGMQNCMAVNNDIEKIHGNIRGTGRATLERYDDLYEQAQKLIELVKLRAKNQTLNENKASKIKRLKGELLLNEKAKELSEIQHRQAIQIINTLREELNDEAKAHDSTKKLWISDLENRDKEIVVLTCENRKLITLLAKVTPIKKVDK